MPLWPERPGRVARKPTHAARLPVAGGHLLADLPPEIARMRLHDRLAVRRSDNDDFQVGIAFLPPLALVSTLGRGRSIFAQVLPLKELAGRSPVHYKKLRHRKVTYSSRMPSSN